MDNLSLKQFGQFVYNYCGLNYLEKLSSLQLKMQKRLEELNIKSYWEYMRYIENNEQEWAVVVENLTINETYFFREDKQFSVLQQHVAPQLLEQNNGQLKIWSAACSTGDEPYSIAITLNQHTQNAKNEVSILATDINDRVLEIAEKATYSKTSLSFRRIPQHWLANYFDETQGYYHVKGSIKQLVQFKYANLYKLEAYDFIKEFDVIFCRNVLIYFDDETVEKIVRKFYDALKPGGYLFLGHAESITKYNIGFKTINKGGTFYYQKG